jgi:sec-independent protein translocase protein TatA
MKRCNVPDGQGGAKMFGFIGNIGPWELIIVLAIILIIFGPGKLPQVGQSMGAAVKNFKKAREDDFDDNLLEDKNPEES